MLGEKVGILIRADTKQAENAIRRFQNSLKGVAKLVTVGVVAKAFKDMASFGKELDLMANRTGMSVEKLSSLRNVFMSAGSGAKGFQQTINKINDGLLGLKRGNPWIAQALAPLGISPFGKDAKQILEEVADAAKAKLSMGYSETTVLDYLMSQLGVDQATAEKLMKGRASLLEEEARLREKTGYVTNENNENLKKLNQSLGELSSAWTNAKANVTGFVSEFLVPIIDKITEFITFLGNHEVIGAGLGIGTALFGGKLFNAALGFIGKHLLGGLVGGAAATTTATTAGGAAGAAAGIGLGTVALATLLLGVIVDTFKTVYDFITTGETGGIIFSVFEAFWGLVFDGFQNAWEWIKEKGRGTWEGIKEWYYNKRVEFGSAYTPDFRGEFLNDAANRKTRDLFYDPTKQTAYVFTDGLISDEDLLDKYKDIHQDIVFENHFEGSTFNGTPQENGEAIGNYTMMSFSKTAQVTPTG